jgi:glutaredoxin
MTARRLELYGSSSCPHTADLREHLEWRNESFVEYDVETDSEADRRLQELIPGRMAIPVLVENGMVATVGWQGRSCVVSRVQLHRAHKS